MTGPHRAGGWSRPLLAGVLAAGLPARSLLGCHSPCKVPSLNDAFAAASEVCLAEVTARVDGGMTDRLTLRVVKRWKGASSPELTVQAESRTCDPLGDMAPVGQRVVLFASMGRSGFDRSRNDPERLVAGFCTGSVVPPTAAREKELSRQLDELARTARGKGR